MSSQEAELRKVLDTDTELSASIRRHEMVPESADAILFEKYYNRDRVHRRLGDSIPGTKPTSTGQNVARMNDYR